MNSFEQNWKFTRKEIYEFESLSLPDDSWTTIDLPHDWAAAGPFSPANDPDITIYDVCGGNI